MQGKDGHLTGLAQPPWFMSFICALHAAEVSSLNKSDQLLVKMMGADEWNIQLLMFSKDASKSRGNIEFNANILWMTMES